MSALRFLFLLGVALIALVSSSSAQPAPGSRKVVLIVCDGLRPDFVTDACMPNLARLGREGTFFTRHHPVYPSSTEVNGTALATGCYPEHSGVIGNREFRPEISPRRVLATEAVSTVRRGDEASGGNYLLRPTLPEILHQAGMTTAVAGTKGVALLMDRSLRREGPAGASPVLFALDALPTGMFENLVETLGGGPGGPRAPNIFADHWTARALTEVFWKSGVPRFSVLWQSDPDFSQHHSGIGSPTALRGLRSVDDSIGLVLKALDDAGERANTDVFVASDHGFSTISRRIDLGEILSQAGFPAHNKRWTHPTPGDIIYDSLGGTVYLYVQDHVAGMVSRLVAFLQTSDFAGVIFARDAIPGTFPMASANFGGANAPDVAVAMRWTDEKNAVGAPGLLIADGERPVGLGTHASLSAYDMHNTLIAAGPDLRRDYQDPLPSGNADVAPTVAHLLRITPAQPMDGRVLKEALLSENAPEAEAPGTLEARAGSWRQTLRYSRCDGTVYLDEGNGAATAP